MIRFIFRWHGKNELAEGTSVLARGIHPDLRNRSKLLTSAIMTRHPRPRQPRPHIPIHNPQLQRLNDNVDSEEHRRKQILRQLTVNAAHLDTPALLLLEGFLQATTTAEQIDMHLSVTGVRGHELFSVRETLLQGKSVNARKVRFESQTAITQEKTSTLQFRKANIDRTRPPSEETQKMREMIITYLEGQRYNGAKQQESTRGDQSSARRRGSSVRRSPHFGQLRCPGLQRFHDHQSLWASFARSLLERYPRRGREVMPGIRSPGFVCAGTGRDQ